MHNTDPIDCLITDIESILRVYRGLTEPSTVEPNFPTNLRFVGHLCRDQVIESLRCKSPQTSADLLNSLAKHGHPFGLGAIGYALRDLIKLNKICKVVKVKNLWSYALRDSHA